MGLGQRIRVKFDSTFQEKINFASGVSLYQDTWIKAEQKTTLWGEVLYVPPFAKEDCLTVQNNNHCEECEKAAYIKNKHPDRDPTPYYCHYSDKGVAYTAQVGDQVCVRYDVVVGELQKDGSRYHKNLLIMPDGSREWMVPYRKIFLYERNGVQYPVGDHWIGEPVLEEELKSDFLVMNSTAKELPDRILLTHGPYAGKVAVATHLQRYHLHHNDYAKESLIANSRNVSLILNDAA